MKIAELYREYTDEDGIWRWWTKWQDSDRLTGRVLIENGKRLIEVEHNTKVKKGFFRKRVETHTYCELYGPERIRYVEESP